MCSGSAAPGISTVPSGNSGIGRPPDHGSTAARARGPPGGRSTANASVTSRLRSVNRNSAAGRPPAGPGGAVAPVGSSRSRRVSTRCRFVADTGCPSAATYSSRSAEMVNSRGRQREPEVGVGELGAQPVAAPRRRSAAWSNAVAGQLVERVPCGVAGQRPGRRRTGPARGTRWRPAAARASGPGRRTPRAARRGRPRGRRPSRRAGGAPTSRRPRRRRGGRRAGPTGRRPGRMPAASSTCSAPSRICSTAASTSWPIGWAPCGAA